MITLNDYLYNGDTVLKIIHSYANDLRQSAEDAHNEIDLLHCEFLPVSYTHLTLPTT